MASQTIHSAERTRRYIACMEGAASQRRTHSAHDRSISEGGIMIRRTYPALWLTACLISCGTEPVSQVSSNSVVPMGTPGRDAGSNPMPPPPPPPAMCGDLNGGGDQHVDFPALMKMKMAEKDEVMARQRA